MKKFLLLPLLLCSFATFAQPKLLQTTGDPDSDVIAPIFNGPKLRLLSIEPAPQNNGMFVLYEKTDTLPFSDPFFKQFESSDFIKEGLAFYEKQSGGYRLRFANDEAFFCASCNNLNGHELTISGDTVTLSASWGPRSFPAFDAHSFVYRPAKKRWQMVGSFTSGSDDAGGRRREYREYTTATLLFLDDYNMEGITFEPAEVKREAAIHYQPGQYTTLLKGLQKIQHPSLLPYIFSGDDAGTFVAVDRQDEYIENGITAGNVAAANNLAYFLEQANALEPAEVLLKKVIEKFPEREVAYLNLGDLYAKKGLLPEAMLNYQVYIRLMARRKLEHKVPVRVREFVGKNKGR